MVDVIRASAHRVMVRPLRLALALFLGASLTVPALPASHAAAAPGPVLEIDASPNVQEEQPITLRVRVRHVPDLAGYELHLLYDTAALEFSGLRQRDKDLPRLGRGIVPLGPVESKDGIAIGLTSCPLDDCAQPRGGRHNKRGNGTVNLAEVSLTPVKPGVMEIAIGGALFVDADGTRVDVAMPAEPLSVTVGARRGSDLYPAPTPSIGLTPGSPAAAPGPFDITGDGRVDQTDVTVARLDWTIAREEAAACVPLSDRRSDVNHDGCIDVSDLQQIAEHYQDPSAATAEGRSLSGEQLAAAPPVTFTVNATSDESDAAKGNGVCATSAGVCTLRAAMDEVNAASGPTNIHFNIPGSGVRTIQLTTALAVWNSLGGVTIDGYTQPGSSPNTDPTKSNAKIMVEIAGPSESGPNGIILMSANNTLRGVSMYRMKRKVWMLGDLAHTNTIVGNFIGTDSTATYVSPTADLNQVAQAEGVNVDTGASGNYIGARPGDSTPNLEDRNVVSGNGFYGIHLNAEGTTNNVVVNNIVGLSPDGLRALPNRWHGVAVRTGTSNNTVGGTGAGQRNVISGNGTNGIKITHDTKTRDNEVAGNFIGTDLTGTSGPSYAANGNFGIMLWDGVNNNTIHDNVIGNSMFAGILTAGFQTGNNQYYNNRIGISLNGTSIPNREQGIRTGFGSSGDRFGPNNIIANNRWDGILITDSSNTGETISRNSIYNNGSNGGGKGIGLAWMANGGIPYPVITAVTLDQAVGTACGSCTVELFIAQRNSTDTTAGNHGQGKTFLVSATAAAGGQFTIPISGVPAGEWVTATATDAAGNTSEFSFNVQVSSAGPPPPSGIRVNSAGPAYTDGSGRQWLPDAFVSGGSVAGFSAPIANTTDDTLYQSQRYGNFSYNFSLPNGTYDVRLMFAESHFSAAGQRVFNVNIEGQQVLTNFDILSQTARNTALDKHFSASVADGILTVTFTSVVDFAVISALEAVPTGPPSPAQATRVNSAGAAYTGSGGQQWSADALFNGGFTASFGVPIANTTDDSLYQTMRYGNFSYDFSLPGGSYQVTLKFAESHFSAAGQRVFNVNIEGQQVLSNFDILAQTARNTALDRAFTVPVTDGSLTVTFTSVVDFAVISAIQVVPAG